MKIIDKHQSENVWQIESVLYCYYKDKMFFFIKQRQKMYIGKVLKIKRDSDVIFSCFLGEFAGYS